MFRSVLLIVALLLTAPALALGQLLGNAPPPAAPETRRGIAAPEASALRAASSPVVDGRLDDVAWTEGAPITAFLQRDPIEGAPASEATDVWIAYDHEAIYVAARLHDRQPVTTRLGRRDMPMSGSDWFRVSFDSLHDRRTAFRFDVNPSGVRRDAVLTGGSTSGDGDLAWDGVWDASTTLDSDGWTVEMRIPFSQLHFTSAATQTWGLQLERLIDRQQEVAMFAFSPKSEQGGVPSFGTLNGLEGIRPGRRLELMPYVLTQGRFNAAGTHPFAGDTDMDANGGLDARYRITSNLTLAATANPDFGQVEVDPAVINLTAFETRYDEKRPFFVEGANSFRFGGTVGGPSATAASLFYSRRLGRSPQIALAGRDTDAPDTATILGAAKLSGKTPSGWSVGVLNALTGAATGRYLDGEGVTQHATVEPRTNYFVGRVARELRHGQTSIGGIFTSVGRTMDGDTKGLRSSASTGGFDFVHEFLDRSWAVTGFLVGSDVQGSEDAILQTQRASTRYYQRPDAAHARLDPHATSLRGLAGSVQLKKSAGLHWTTDSWVQMISPGFEINDIGFLQRSDRRGFGQGITYKEQRPGRILRDWKSTTYVNRATNYDGDVIDYFYWTSLTATHTSYWQGTASVWYEPKRTDDRFTRGGPLAIRPANWRYNAAATSDPRRTISGSASFAFVGDRAGSDSRTWDIAVTARTSPRWNLSVGPRLTQLHQDEQYVSTVNDAAAVSTGGARYIFAPLDQTEVSIVTRLNVTFTPNLSLEMYAQPLVSNGVYATPRQFLTPATYDFAEYGRDLGTLTRTSSGYLVDPDAAGPLNAFTVPDRSFTARSLRGNAVLRWEYRPGSALFVVWQQDRLDSDRMNDFSVGRAFGAVFDGQANNVLAVKWSYWINP
jgi:hypothetical protein